MSIKILYLYAELMGYQIPILEKYVKNHASTVHVVHWNKKKLTPYLPPDIEGVTYYNRSEHDEKSLIKLAKDINPQIIYISGWQDRGYLSVVRELRKLKKPVVVGFDDQWKGSFRQYLASFAFPFIKKLYFSHAWVAGAYQYEYARKLGFQKNEIAFNLLSCDDYFFSRKEKYHGENFLYVGNFRSVKGTDILVDAFKLYKEHYNGRWGLICVGNGDMENYIKTNSCISLIAFSDKKTLMEITNRCGAFILPSRHEQWGVVVHEFAALGLPLILSENIGTRSTFFIDKFNGISFSNDSPQELALAMKEISSYSQEKLSMMGNNSVRLAARIDSEISAASFLSILK